MPYAFQSLLCYGSITLRPNANVRKPFVVFASSVLKLLKKAIAQNFHWENHYDSLKIWSAKLYPRSTFVVYGTLYMENFQDEKLKTYRYVLHESVFKKTGHCTHLASFRI